MSTPPEQPRIYHILHVDRLRSVIQDGHLLCDAKIAQRSGEGTTIGMSRIKERRLESLRLQSHPELHVGECVPFYFCPRSIMLYMIHRGNDPELAYRGGQGPIVHLEASLDATVRWADANNQRWAFTLSNAGAIFFEDRCTLAALDEIDWPAVEATDWREHKDGKQAEFLIEEQFPWHLVSRVGAVSPEMAARVSGLLEGKTHQPTVEVRRDWYY